MAVTVTHDEVEELVTDVLVDAIGVERELISLDATLESLDIDSLDLVEVAQVVEERWGFRIRAEDAKGVGTLGEAIEMIVKLGRLGAVDDAEGSLRAPAGAAAGHGPTSRGDGAA